jgi:hypothetical protein
MNETEYQLVKNHEMAKHVLYIMTHVMQREYVNQPMKEAMDAYCKAFYEWDTGIEIEIGE